MLKSVTLGPNSLRGIESSTCTAMLKGEDENLG